MNMLRRSRGTTAIAQLSSNQAAVSSPHLESPQVLSVSSELRGVDAWDSRVLVWTDDGADVFELSLTGAKHVAAFAITEGSFLAIHQSFIFQTEDESVKVLDFQGAVKQVLPLCGKALCLDVCEEFLAVATGSGYIRLWRIGRADVKPFGLPSGRKVITDGDLQQEVTSIRCSSDCSKISFLVKCLPHAGNDSHIYIYDTVMDKILSFDFRAVNQEPITHCWDGREPRLLACETIQRLEQVEESIASAGKSSEVHATTFFVSFDNGILKLEQMTLESQSGLLGVDIPYVHVLSAHNSESTGLAFVIKNRTMRDFVGLEDVDMRARAALVDFNYHLATSNLDEAYRVVKDIADKEIWLSIARICVKTRRVEVALHCFAEIGCPSAAAYVRGSYVEEEEDTRVAAVAIQLGLLEEAREAYGRCKRYDLLNQLHQRCGEWDKAIEVASKHDRIHLKGTLHAYAKHLESIGNIKDAIHQYELSGNHRSEVPRMLYARRRIEELRSYVNKSGDPVLQQWWGHYCEANDMLPQAIEYYKAAGDISSLVRVYCFQKDFSTSAALVQESSDAAAAFELARQYEKAGDIRQAINFFSKAGKAIYGARLAMKHNIDNELLALSLQSGKEMMLAAAKYHEEKEKYEEAILLYHKGGNLEKAINVCFRTQLFDALKAIAEDLAEDSDPVLLAKCGDFLLQHKQADKAVHLYIAAKQYNKALDVCVNEGVLLTDKMAEEMNPKSGEQKSEESVSLLSRIAEVFNAQGSYHLACKKYTQAGDRISAMKALLRSGDTERIIFCANLSRQNEMYIMAANYLQSLDWHHDADIMKTIIQMYTKAGDMESLASFYEACSQIEIDEFRDYEKALGAMKEALKCLSKSVNSRKDEKVQPLMNRIAEVERFLQVRRMARSDPVGMIRSCSDILHELSDSTNSSQAAVRKGDVYALLIEYYHSQGSMEQAYQMIEKMRARKIALGPYIDMRLVQMIYQAIGVDIEDQDLGEDISEEINEL